MKISTKGRYALRVMIDLALNDDGRCISLKDVASRQGITLKYLEQIIPLLSKAGLLRSIRGNSGGYLLSKPASEYTIGEILRAAEGSLAPVDYLSEQNVKCDTDYIILPVWKGLHETIDNYLDKITLEKIVDDYKNISTDNYYI